ncbi:MAG: creatininase family protein [Alphaproteobacteria bacterium]|nr:creatininase family protein [Alphaproteobacteria bacterium]
MRGAWLEELTWDEAKDALDGGWPVLFPVGAAAKEHGLHLPLATDYLIARDLAERLLERLPILVAPVIGFGHYPAFLSYAGSQSLSAATFIALIVELAEGLIAQGARRIAYLNTGVSTEAPLQIAARQVFDRHGVRPAIADLRRLGRNADHVLARPGGGHADERETAIMLAIAPERVRLARAALRPGAADEAGQVLRQPVRLSPVAADGCLTSESGATGDASAASAEKGHIVLASILEELEEGLRSLWPDAFSARAAPVPSPSGTA